MKHKFTLKTKARLSNDVGPNDDYYVEMLEYDDDIVDKLREKFAALRVEPFGPAKIVINVTLDVEVETR